MSERSVKVEAAAGEYPVVEGSDCVAIDATGMEPGSRLLIRDCPGLKRVVIGDMARVRIQSCPALEVVECPTGGAAESLPRSLQLLDGTAARLFELRGECHQVRFEYCSADDIDVRGAYHVRLVHTRPARLLLRPEGWVGYWGGGLPKAMAGLPVHFTPNTDADVALALTGRDAEGQERLHMYIRQAASASDAAQRLARVAKVAGRLPAIDQTLARAFPYESGSWAAPADQQAFLSARYRIWRAATVTALVPPLDDGLVPAQCAAAANVLTDARLTPDQARSVLQGLVGLLRGSTRRRVVSEWHERAGDFVPLLTALAARPGLPGSRDYADVIFEVFGGVPQVLGALRRVGLPEATERLEQLISQPSDPAGRREALMQRLCLEGDAQALVPFH